MSGAKLLKTATITISGEVQDAGFRGKVMRIAQKVNLVGYIENVPDGTVIVVCEGEEEVINGFLKDLDIKDDDITVENIEVVWSDPTGGFERFEVKFTNLGMEMFQGFSTAGKKLSAVGHKVESVSSDIRAMHTDLKEGFKETKDGLDNVEGSIKEMNTAMNDRFEIIDDKYGAISQQMSVLTSELQKSTNALVSLTGKVGSLIDKKLSE